MRYFVLILLLLISLPASVPVAVASQDMSQAQGDLVRSIRIEGFVLGDKSQFVKLFKPYRNRYLSENDIDTILQNLEEIYEQAGYQGLISIEHKVERKTLTFNVSLIK